MKERRIGRKDVSPSRTRLPHLLLAGLVVTTGYILCTGYLFFPSPAMGDSCEPRKAALSGNAESQNLLGLAYIDGKQGCSQNSERGIRWLKKAAAGGSQNAIDNLCWAYGGGYMPDKSGNRVANPLLPVRPKDESYWCSKADVPF